MSASTLATRVGSADAEEGNHRSRRMGPHRGPGDRTRRAGAARAKTPAAHTHGGYPQAARQRQGAGDSEPAPRPGQMPAIPQPRSAGDLQGVRDRRGIRLSRLATGRENWDYRHLPRKANVLLFMWFEDGALGG